MEYSSGSPDLSEYRRKLSREEVEKWAKEHRDPVFGEPLTDSMQVQCYRAVVEGGRQPTFAFGWHYLVRIPGFAKPTEVRLPASIEGPTQDQREFYLGLLGRLPTLVAKAKQWRQERGLEPEDASDPVYPRTIEIFNAIPEGTPWYIGIHCGRHGDAHDLIFRTNAVGERITTQQFDVWPSGADDEEFEREPSTEETAKWASEHADPILGAPIVDGWEVQDYRQAVARGSGSPSGMWRYVVTLPGFCSPTSVMLSGGVEGPSPEQRSMYSELVERVPEFIAEVDKLLRERTSDVPETRGYARPQHIDVSPPTAEGISWRVEISCAWSVDTQDLCYTVFGINQTVLKRDLGM